MELGPGEAKARQSVRRRRRAFGHRGSRRADTKRMRKRRGRKGEGVGETSRAQRKRDGNNLLAEGQRRQS
eukprot:1543358-Pleurochrysis_carterae.AAC.3